MKTNDLLLKDGEQTFNRHNADLEEIIHDFKFKKQAAEIKIEKMEHSIKNNSGDTLADIYFEKPIMISDSDIASKINEYFDLEYSNWLNGNADRLSFYQSNYMSYFLESVEDMRNYLSDDKMKIQPLKYIVKSNVSFSDSNILSVKQNVYWFSGGPMSYWCFGTTFDLKTGDVIPFTYFYDVSPNDFWKSLITVLDSNNFNDYLSDFGIKSVSEFDLKNDFYYEFEGHKWNMENEYYFDGSDICLTLNQIKIHCVVMVKLNIANNSELDMYIPDYQHNIMNIEKP